MKQFLLIAGIFLSLELSAQTADSTKVPDTVKAPVPAAIQYLAVYLTESDWVAVLDIIKLSNGPHLSVEQVYNTLYGQLIKQKQPGTVPKKPEGKKLTSSEPTGTKKLPAAAKPKKK